ncbi:MAG: hypothetical protein ACTSU5_08150 [Promethearchaeota archaeon]
MELPAKGLVVSISHGEDLDGLASQAIVTRYFREGAAGSGQRPGVTVRWYRENYATLADRLYELSRDVDAVEGLVVLTDIGFNDSFKGPFAALAGAFRRGSLYYFDHHEGTRKVRGWLRGRGVRVVTSEDSKCAARLVQESLLPGDDHARLLAKEACDSDNTDPGRSEFNRRLSRAIGLLSTLDVRDPRLERITELMLEPGFQDDPWLVGVLDDCEERYRRELELVRDRVRVEDVKGLRVASSWSPVLSSGLVVTRIFDTFLAGDEPDLAVGVNPTGKVSFKTERPDLDVASLAKRFGGGGHRDRSGFNTGSRIQDVEGFFDAIAVKLESFLGKVGKP